MGPVKIIQYLGKGLRAGYPVSRLLRTKGPRPGTESLGSPEKGLSREVQYALQVAENYLNQLGSHGITVRGKQILELGPGRSLGTALLLACHGARVTAVEPDPAPWDPDYHPRFYAAMLERLSGPGTSLDLDSLQMTVEQGRIPKEAVRLVRGNLLQARGIGPESQDAVFSNAVLEHVAQLPETLAELARVTRPGGLGFHQIDFRFHPRESDPLRFLLFSPAKYERLRSFTGRGCGSCLRLSQYERLFAEAGFRILRREVTQRIEPEYLERFRRRLKRRRNSLYRDWPKEDLEILSARLEVVREG